MLVHMIKRHFVSSAWPSVASQPPHQTSKLGWIPRNLILALCLLVPICLPVADAEGPSFTPQQSFSLWLSLAQKGDKEAQYLFGSGYMSGTGVAPEATGAEFPKAYGGTTIAHHDPKKD